MDWTEIVDREGRLLLETARLAPGADVPACPAFDMTRLVRHVDFVLRRVRVALAGTATTPFRRDDSLPPPVAVEEAFAAYPVDLDALLAAFASTDPATPTWTMVDPTGSAGFWLRRAAHEITVHRVDAQQAAGQPVTPIAAGQAADGIAEVLGIAAARWEGATASPATVHLHATDEDGEWLVRFAPGAMSVESGHAKGDAAVRGPVGDLHLWLWGRAPIDTLEVFGDAGPVGLLREAVAAI